MMSYIPETVAFDGLAKLPDDIAAEMRELYLLKKPWDQRSEKFLAVARTGQPYSSRWNWMGGGKYVEGVWQPTERGGGPYGPVTHIFSRGAKIAYTYWQRYEYTLDKTWLRDRAYPMLKGVAEFYRNYPNIQKGDDGKYHIHHVNSNESVQGGRDPDEEIASIMGILPAVIKASEILGVDAEMRPVWKEFLANLAPLPTGGNLPVWIRALPPRRPTPSAWVESPMHFRPRCFRAKKAEDVTGDVLTFPTYKGETIVVAPQGSRPPAKSTIPIGWRSAGLWTAHL